MLRWLGRLLLLGLLLLGLAAFALVLIAGLAGSRGVREVTPRVTALMDSAFAESSYRDAYLVTIPRGSFSRPEDLRDAAFRKGREVGRRGHEVLYRKRVFGIDLYTDYAVVRSGGEPAILVTTVAHLHGTADRVRLAFFKPVHRKLMPLLVGRMASSAVVDTEPD